MTTQKGLIVEQLGKPAKGVPGIDIKGGDFHALSSAQVGRLLHWAKAYGYREPKNANGSRARCFFYMLQRFATKEAKLQPPKLAEIIKAQIARFDNSELSVDVSTTFETVNIQCFKTQQDHFMQGSDAADFIAEAEKLMNNPECEDFSWPDIYKYLAYPYAENLFN